VRLVNVSVEEFSTSEQCPEDGWQLAGVGTS